MKKIERQGLHAHVVDEIGKWIIGKEISTGSLLPSEADLCGTLGVSRTALREALRVLAAKGLVEARPKVGTSVRHEDKWNYLDADVLAWRLEVGDFDRAIAELYQLRHLIEPMAASLAATHASPKDVDQLRQAYLAMEAAGDDGILAVDPDVWFHTAIIAASGNSLFSSLGHAISAALTINFRVSADNPRGQVHSLPLHKNVLDAIAVGDASGARVAMQRLIEDSEHDVRSIRTAQSRALRAPSRR